ncbi:hypothetical protein [Fusobacterium varium]|jgi:hypothetical protein|uniref:hypothetical protein n=1 Tax=Fusobacterium varium TaxID=856 RepID=UPI00266CC3BB|nr:hypothetical protein [Fusobacterium varium]
MGLEIMKRIDFNKMEFRTFIEELEKQFIKKFSIKENQGLEILFKALQEEDDPGQVNYLYYWCKKPIEEREIMEELNLYGIEYFIDKGYSDIEDEEESELYFNIEVDKLKEKIELVIEILRKVDITKFDKKYEREYKIIKFFYEKFLEDFKIKKAPKGEV